MHELTDLVKDAGFRQLELEAGSTSSLLIWKHGSVWIMHEHHRALGYVIGLVLFAGSLRIQSVFLLYKVSFTLSTDQTRKYCSNGFTRNAR